MADYVSRHTGVAIDNAIDDVSVNSQKVSFDSGSSTKLAGIEEGATKDQTPLEIKSAYESNLDTNVLTDAEKAVIGALPPGSTMPDNELLDRTNHHGQQPANSISDFDASVTLSPSVVANAAKVTYPSADAAKLADIEEFAQQNVKSNWDSGGGDNEILNKPTVITTAERNAIPLNTAHRNAPHAPSEAEQNVQVDWQETNSADDAFINNKPVVPDLNAIDKILQSGDIVAVCYHQELTMMIRVGLISVLIPVGIMKH